MKTLKLTLSFLLLSTVGLFAQNIPMTMFEEIKGEQVPATVLKTFETEFGQIKNNIKKGVWYAHFEHTPAASTSQSYGTYVESTKSMAVPLHYSYKGKLDGKNVEIKFTPQGNLAYTKGLPD